MRQIAAALLVTSTGRQQGTPRARRTPAPPDDPPANTSPPRPKPERESPSRVWEPTHARG
jgi:hypothetical protein